MPDFAIDPPLDGDAEENSPPTIQDCLDRTADQSADRWIECNAIKSGRQKTELLNQINEMLGELEGKPLQMPESVPHDEPIDATAPRVCAKVPAIDGDNTDFSAKSSTVMDEIRAWNKKRQPKGKIRPEEYKEFCVDPADPLALQKVKVAHVLKKMGSTLVDLEKFEPDFWKLPLKTTPGEKKKSRAWTLKTFKWNKYDEGTALEREALKYSKRQKRRAEKICAKGWRADYYDLSAAEKKRERDKVWRQKERGP
jgi:hypothetical protein